MGRINFILMIIISVCDCSGRGRAQMART